MATEVTSLNSGNSEVLTTQDLLGSLTKNALQIPDNVDKHLNFKPEKVFQSPSSSSSSSQSSSCMHKRKQESILQDLNYPLSPKFLQQTCNFDPKLDLSSRYHSVCTLDKVKFALEREEKQAKNKKQKQFSSSHRSVNNKEDEDQAKEQSDSSCSDIFAAGCPGCLFYVITFRTNPKCPRCNSIVPIPMAFKRPRIDLNA